MKPFITILAAFFSLSSFAQIPDARVNAAYDKEYISHYESQYSIPGLVSEEIGENSFILTPDEDGYIIISESTPTTTTIGKVRQDYPKGVRRFVITAEREYQPYRRLGATPPLDETGFEQVGNAMLEENFMADTRNHLEVGITRDISEIKIPEMNNLEVDDPRPPQVLNNKNVDDLNIVNPW